MVPGKVDIVKIVIFILKLEFIVTIRNKIDGCQVLFAGAVHRFEKLLIIEGSTLTFNFYDFILELILKLVLDVVALERVAVYVCFGNINEIGSDFIHYVVIADDLIVAKNVNLLEWFFVVEGQATEAYADLSRLDEKYFFDFLFLLADEFLFRIFGLVPSWHQAKASLEYKVSVLYSLVCYATIPRCLTWHEKALVISY